MHKSKVRAAIVSSGPKRLAHRAKRELGMDHIMANCIYVSKANRFTGQVKVEVDNNHKSRALSVIQKKLRVAPERPSLSVTRTMTLKWRKQPTSPSAF
ncbi:MAG: haloacid dehalogenase-like hydrolase [Pseudomonadota bacterium]